ncbi:MAG TPA: type II toxin-antitoxin system RelE/ParE family toxin [Thermoanaerobaculia bacterium]|nr:type II toxin-antitoxin system RelE/ParE family toxin [Thermoanaerobaculia bacterium]
MAVLVVALLEAAEGELDDAIAVYDSQRPRAGVRFRDAVKTALTRLTDHPELGRSARYGVRRYVIPGWPYDVVYELRAETILVIAVAHHSRRPRYWRDRLSSR